MATNGFSIGKLLVVGVGLIGGSLALCLKRNGAVGSVTGYGRRVTHLRTAKALGVIDHYVEDLAEAVEDADLIFLGVPVAAMGPMFEKIVGGLSAGAVVTDAGSTKCSVIAAARSSMQDRFDRFVPGHPIAGSERSGVEAATADLYRDHRVLLTPTAQTAADAVQIVEAMWRCTGASVELMDAEQHDRILGLTSHLPHVLAYSLVNFIAKGEDAEKCFELAAGGFFDFTRIASSDPVMWRDIAMSNPENLCASIDRFIKELEHIKALTGAHRAEELEEIFRCARDARNQLIDRRSRA